MTSGAPNSHGISYESRAGSSDVLLRRPAVSFSSFKPTKGNVKDIGASSFRLKLAPGEVSFTNTLLRTMLMYLASCYCWPV